MMKKIKRFYVLQVYKLTKQTYIQKQKLAALRERLQAGVKGFEWPRLQLRLPSLRLPRLRLPELSLPELSLRKPSLPRFRFEFKARLVEPVLEWFARAGQSIKRMDDAITEFFARRLWLIKDVLKSDIAQTRERWRYALQFVGAGITGMFVAFGRMGSAIAEAITALFAGIEKALINTIKANVTAAYKTGLFVSTKWTRTKAATHRFFIAGMHKVEKSRAAYQAKIRARKDVYFQREVNYMALGSAFASFVLLFILVAGFTTGNIDVARAMKAPSKQVASAEMSVNGGELSGWQAIIHALIEPAAGEEGASDVEQADDSTMPPESQMDENPLMGFDDVFERYDDSLEVQAVLVAKNKAVISGTMDGHITELPFKSGDRFKEGDVLVRYDCKMEEAQLQEANAKMRLAKAQMDAAKQLFALDTVSEIERVRAVESFYQAEAVVNQLSQRLRSCEIVAPFDGRVANSLASMNEYVQRGRVLMEVTASDKLNAEFLVPSIWLRWMNVDTPLDIFVQESGKIYSAKIIRIHGEVDPVSRSVQVVAEIDSYQEDLLPGMSGRAIFSKDIAVKGMSSGFLGLVIEDGSTRIDPPSSEPKEH